MSKKLVGSVLWLESPQTTKNNNDKCIHSIKSWLFHRNPSHVLWLMTIPYYYCNGIKGSLMYSATIPGGFGNLYSATNPKSPKHVSSGSDLKQFPFFSSGSLKGAKLLHPWNLTCPLKRGHFKRKWILFQPAFFRGHVGLREYTGCSKAFLLCIPYPDIKL